MSKLAYIVFTFFILGWTQIEACEKASSVYGIPENVVSCRSEFEKYHDELETFQPILNDPDSEAIEELISFFEEHNDRELECTVHLTVWLPGELWRQQPTDFSQLLGDLNRYVRVVDENLPERIEKKFLAEVRQNLLDMRDYIELLISHPIEPREYKPDSCRNG